MPPLKLRWGCYGRLRGGLDAEEPRTAGPRGHGRGHPEAGRVPSAVTCVRAQHVDPCAHMPALATSTPTWAQVSHLRGGDGAASGAPTRTRQSRRGAARHRVENERCCRYSNIPVKCTFGVFGSWFGVGHAFLPLQREATPRSDPPGPRAERQSGAHPSRPLSAGGRTRR